MSIIPPAPEAKLTREGAAAALTEAGFPISAATLATMATRGGGPLYCIWGSRVLYAWADLVAWAENRIGKPRRSTSEGDHGAGRQRPAPCR